MNARKSLDSFLRGGGGLGEEGKGASEGASEGARERARERGREGGRERAMGGWQIKLLRGGIEMADRVVTVAPSYRDEIQAP